MKHKSQENAAFIAIHPTTYRSGGFLAHGVLKNVKSYLYKRFLGSNIDIDFQTETTKQ